MKASILLLTLLFPLSLSAVNDKYIEALPHCGDRVEKLVLPKFPFHQEKVIEKHGQCIVKVNLSIDESGIQNIDGYYVDNLYCRSFIKNSIKATKQYTFKKGAKDRCHVQVIFEFDGNGT